MTERTARGYMVQSTVAYIENTYDQAVRARIYEAMTPRGRELAQNVNTVAWYPVEDVADVFRGIAQHHRQTDGKVREALADVGRQIARTATGTFLKFILKLLTPALFAAKMPDLWKRDNRCGTLTAIEYAADKKRMVVVLSGVGRYDFIGPVAPGFILYALEEPFGLKNVRVEFEWSLDDPGPEELTYVFTWN